MHVIPLWPWPMTAVAGGNLWSPTPHPNNDDDEFPCIFVAVFIHLLEERLQFDLHCSRGQRSTKDFIERFGFLK